MNMRNLTHMLDNLPGQLLFRKEGKTNKKRQKGEIPKHSSTTHSAPSGGELSTVPKWWEGLNPGSHAQ